MRRLTVFLAAAASVLSFAPAAFGAPVCNLVTDKPGDQAVEGVYGTGTFVSPDLDLRTADVAVNSRHVVAVLRLASLRPFDPRYPVSRTYTLRFWLETDTNDRVYSLNAMLSPTAVVGWVTGPPAGWEGAVVSVDYARAEIRVAASVGHFGTPALNRGRELMDIQVETAQHVGIGPRMGQAGPITFGGASSGHDVTADQAIAPRSYRGGTPTCVAMPR